MKPLHRELVAGAGAGFFLLMMLPRVGLLPALILAAMVFLALRVMLPARGRRKVGLSRGQLETLHQLRAKAVRFDELATKISTARVAEVSRKMGQIVRDLGQQFERDPDSLLPAGEVLEVHLPKALSIVERYSWLAAQNYLDDDARRELAAAEETIQLIEEAFVALHSRLLGRDLRELSVDRRVFEELLQFDDRFAERLDAAAPAAAEEQPRDGHTGGDHGFQERL